MTLEITIENYRCFSEESPLSIEIGDGFTALIGPNNSGKSTILRFFFEFREFLRGISDITNLKNAAHNQVLGFNYPSLIEDQSEIFFKENSNPIKIMIKHKESPIRLIFQIPRNTNTWKVNIFVNNKNLDWSKIQEHSPSLYPDPQTKRNLDFNIILHEIKNLVNTLYIGPFRNTINIGTQSDYFDISIGQSFIAFWKDSKSGPNRKGNETALRITKDIQEIFGFQQFEINPTGNDQNLQIFINEKSYRLQELGSGLAQFIVVFINAALRQPSFILIDEPELNLHPQLQIDFLTSLASFAENGVIFCTHNYGLARATADKIYVVKRGPEGRDSNISQLENTDRLPELLGELSFRGYSELGFKNILLVEGVTDIKTVHQILRKFRKDHENVVLHMGGEQLINGKREEELAEVKRISERVFALIDSEKKFEDSPISKNRADFQKSCEKLKIKCHILERRAIENYFPETAIKRALGEKFRALEPFEKLGNGTSTWKKTQNWRIAREMAKKELEETDLGKFLANI